MPNVYSVILEYVEKQESKSIGSHKIIDGGWVRNTWYKYALLSWVSQVTNASVHLCGFPPLFDKKKNYTHCKLSK